MLNSNMHNRSGVQISPQKAIRLQRWGTQDQFLQSRCKVNHPELILVGTRFSEDRFDLLSWVLNVAARPRDVVIALHLGTLDDKIGHATRIAMNKRELQFETQLKPLRDLANAKQVKLEMRYERDVNTEKVLLEQALGLKATMLVVSTSGHHILRHSQKKGSFLARNVHEGCSIVVVKNYKVLFYRESAFKVDTPASSFTCSEDGSQSIPKENKVVGKAFASVEKQLLPMPQSSFKQMLEVGSDLNTSCAKDDKIHPEATNCSPRGVLEVPGISSESDIGSPSSSYSSITYSLSKTPLLSGVVHSDETDCFTEIQPRNCLSFRKNFFKKCFTSPLSTRRSRRISDSFRCSSMRRTIMSYVGSLWSTEAVDQVSTYLSPTLSDQKKSWRCFSYDELVLATDGFNPDNLVGKGGCAEVYKGPLSEGQIVAIKRLTRDDSEAAIESNFLTELGIISHVSHPNTVRLIGCCIDKGLYLIFNFSTHGSLASLLHSREGPILDWHIRYKVATGTARGLHYLHTGCKHRIIHRDIKASNILLGADFEPQISDFGLAKWLPEEWTHHVVTPVEGTFGYLAPEYFMHGTVDEKTDVFAFGVLLLELITGREPIDTSQQSLVIWAKPLLECLNIEELADPRLDGAYDMQEIQCMALVAGLCVQQSPVCRPSMNQVVQLLTDECLSSETMNSWSTAFSQPAYFQDFLVEEYSCSKYMDDLSRHRQMAFQF